MMQIGLVLIAKFPWLIPFIPLVLQIARLSEWTLLAAGALSGFIALGYFFPKLRAEAVAAALIVLAGYAGALYGDRTGRADILVQWTRADQEARRDAAERDARADADAKAQLEQATAGLKMQALQLQQKVDDYAAELAKRNAIACLLGPIDLQRLRNIK